MSVRLARPLPARRPTQSAIRELVYNEVFEEPIGQLLLENDMVRIVVFSEETEEVLRWIP